MDFLTILKIILIGIVEGITEWLPISSTGHMIVLEEVLGLQSSLGSEYWSMFLVVIQFGAIMAVIVTFFKQLWPFGSKKSKEEKKEIWRTWLLILIACVPAGVVGLLFDKILDRYLYNYITVSITLIVYGIFFIALELIFKKKNKQFDKNELRDMTYKTAFIIGLAQMLSLIPGTSRSGITILAAMMIGCSRELSAKFSFMVSIPVMVGASLYKVVDYVAIEKMSISREQIIYLLIGMVVAFLVSLACIKFLTAFVKKHTFIGFGIYRIALGVFLILLFLTTSLGHSSQIVDSSSSEVISSILFSLPYGDLGAVLI